MMQWDTDDHAIYPLPTDEPGMSPQAGRSVIVLAPFGLVLWLVIGRIALWLLDALERVIFALAGALFVIAIAASFAAVVFAALDLL